ncbi:hypothetical protein GDO78_017632 [Eleutherodactylus coqui]|uniref:Secreted protein n=1 Tax=Eleutherodactylus coqui TaxID=57060 RepID=A0A8J6BDV1_ELECQ|nr:hypothetical protein GDO78_017632 [Eleutherodactylus coqui]
MKKGKTRSSWVFFSFSLAGLLSESLGARAENTKKQKRLCLVCAKRSVHRVRLQKQVRIDRGRSQPPLPEQLLPEKSPGDPYLGEHLSNKKNNHNKGERQM